MMKYIVEIVAVFLMTDVCLADSTPSGVLELTPKFNNLNTSLEYLINATCRRSIRNIDGIGNNGPYVVDVYQEVKHAEDRKSVV